MGTRVFGKINSRGMNTFSNEDIHPRDSKHRQLLLLRVQWHWRLRDWGLQEIRKWKESANVYGERRKKTNEKRMEGTNAMRPLQEEILPIWLSTHPPLNYFRRRWWGKMTKKNTNVAQSKVFLRHSKERNDQKWWFRAREKVRKGQEPRNEISGILLSSLSPNRPCSRTALEEKWTANWQTPNSAIHDTSQPAKTNITEIIKNDCDVFGGATIWFTLHCQFTAPPTVLLLDNGNDSRTGRGNPLRNESCHHSECASNGKLLLLRSGFHPPGSCWVACVLLRTISVPKAQVHKISSPDKPD